MAEEFRAELSPPLIPENVDAEMRRYLVDFAEAIRDTLRMMTLGSLGVGDIDIGESWRFVVVDSTLELQKFISGAWTTMSIWEE